MEQVLNALKAKLKEQDKATDRYDYRCGLHDAIKIVETFVNQDKVKEFEQLAHPMIQYLCENYHPHVAVVITPTNAELLEGKMSTGKIMDYVRD